MAYDEKFKRRVIEYKDSRHTFAEVREAFKVDSQRYYVWKRQLDQTGKLYTHSRKIARGKSTLKNYSYYLRNIPIGIESDSRKYSAFGIGQFKSGSRK